MQTPCSDVNIENAKLSSTITTGRRCLIIIVATFSVILTSYNPLMSFSTAHSSSKNVQSSDGILRFDFLRYVRSDTNETFSYDHQKYAGPNNVGSERKTRFEMSSITDRGFKTTDREPLSHDSGSISVDSSLSPQSLSKIDPTQTNNKVTLPASWNLLVAQHELTPSNTHSRLIITTIRILRQKWASRTIKVKRSKGRNGGASSAWLRAALRWCGAPRGVKP